MKQFTTFSIIVTVILALIQGCSNQSVKGQAKVSLPYTINDSDISGATKVITSIDEVRVSEASNVLGFKSVDGIQIVLLLDDREEVIGLNTIVNEDRLVFDAEQTARSFVLINSIFWGWSSTSLRELYELIPNDERFHSLTDRVRSKGRLDIGDSALIELSNQIAEATAKRYSETLSETALTPQAILQQLSPLPRFVFLQQPSSADLRQLKVTNRGLMNNRIFAFPKGTVKNYSLEFLNHQQGASCVDQGGASTDFLSQPFKLFGWVPIDSVTGRNFINCTLDVPEDSYNVFEVVACTHCLGSTFINNPRYMNTLELVLSFFEFATGSQFARDEIFRSDIVQAAVIELLNAASLPDNILEIIELFQQRRYQEASVAITDVLIEHIDIIVDIYAAVISDELDSVAKQFFVKMLKLVEPTFIGTFEKIETIGNATYVSAFVASYFWTWSEYGGYFPTALVSTQDPKLDVVFLLDSTSSMRGILTTAQNRATDIQEGIKESRVFADDTQFGLADFKDYPLSPYGEASDYTFSLRQQLTTNETLWQQALFDIRAVGGRDAPESQLTALFQSANVFSWRDDAFPVLILITDAPAHDADVEAGYPGVGFNEAMNALNQRNVKVIGLAASSNAIEILERTANATGTRLASGQPVVLSITLSGEDLVDQIIQALQSLLGVDSSASSVLSRTRYQGLSAAQGND